MSMLPTVKAFDVQESGQQKWLVESLWTDQAVGFIVGQPKSGKSWLAHDFAVSVASGTSVLDTFPVKHPGPVLMFPAEDAITAAKGRLLNICTYRGLDLKSLDVWFIGSYTLRLDTPDDQKALEKTVEHLRPRLLILDPLIRLHSVDENSATEIAKVLSFLRNIQRKHNVAVLIAHHARKNTSGHPGLGLRGSSEIRAWGDSILYLQRKNSLELSVEHRAAPAPDPLTLTLVTDDSKTVHLAIDEDSPEEQKPDLRDQILTLLNQHGVPLTRSYIRSKVRVRNQRVCDTLKELEQEDLVMKTDSAYVPKNGALFK